MMYAADHAGVKYGQYATDHRVLVDSQIAIAQALRFRLCFLHLRSGPRSDRLRSARGDLRRPAAGDRRRRMPCWPTKQALATLQMPDPLAEGRMLDRVRAAALFQQEVGDTKLIEGWIEGPCAEAADLRGINTLMIDFFDDPDFVRDLFEFTLQLGIRFARAQVEAGVDLIGVGDAAASLIGPQFYEEFVWPYEKRLVEELHAMGTRVRLHICGNICSILEPIGKLGCDIVDLDFMVPVDKARQAMGDSQILLGNIDPVRVLKNGSPESITAAIAAVPSEGRTTVYRGGRLRSPPRHSPRKPAGPDRVRSFDRPA